MHQSKGHQGGEARGGAEGGEGYILHLEWKENSLCSSAFYTVEFAEERRCSGVKTTSWMPCLDFNSIAREEENPLMRSIIKWTTTASKPNGHWSLTRSPHSTSLHLVIEPDLGTGLYTHLDDL